MKVSLQEQTMKILLDGILVNETFIDNYRPDWLKNPNTGHNLELDRYYPNLKIAFEYNGPQHRRKNDEEQWKRDKIKKTLCAKEGVIRLVVYKKELKKEILYNKIQDVKNMREAWVKGMSWTKK